MHMHVYLYVFVVCMYMHLCLKHAVHTHTHTHTYIYMFVCVYIYIHTTTHRTHRTHIHVTCLIIHIYKSHVFTHLQLAELFARGREQLEIVKRQATLSSMFTPDKDYVVNMHLRTKKA
jgi:hypothetical protein